MATPLDPSLLPSLPTLLQRCQGRDWLILKDEEAGVATPAHQQFWTSLETLTSSLAKTAGSPWPLCIREVNPWRCLATILAALGQGRRVVLTNPQWGSREWQQVGDLIQPDWSAPVVPDLGCYPCRALAPEPLVDIWIPSGGSGGQVRFVGHSWATLMTAVEGFRLHFGVEVVHAYCVLPLHHVSGLMQALRVLASGGCLALQSYGDLKRETWLPFPQDSFLSLVPTQLQWLLAQGDRYLARLQTYRAVLLGGAPASPALIEQARQRAIPLALTYGMSETASQAATLLPSEFLAGHQSSGRSLPHVHLEIINDQGDCLAPGGVGAIALETPCLFRGYWPPLPTPCQGRFVTDDLGYLDDQGYVHVLGRRSTTIITGGEKVLPQEVEQLLLATGQLTDVCVVGLADPHWGQCLCALIVPGPDFAGLNPLMALMRSQLASYKQPKRWLVLAAIPRTTEGKLLRGMALALAQERA